MLLRCSLRCAPRRNKDKEHCREVELHGIFEDIGLAEKDRKLG